jgi:putative phage-type endonuclease
MKLLADLSKITEAEWLELRRGGLGSSDAAAVLGVSSFKSPLALYAEKLGLAEPEAESPAMRWGKLLEATIAQEYARETGRAVYHPKILLQHEKHEFMLATPDRFATVHKAPKTFTTTLADHTLLVEIKTAGAYKADDWAEEPPLEYQVQVQHGLAVTGFDLASLVVLIGGQRLLWVDLERNDRFIAVLIEREREFWERIQKLEPPAATGADKETLAKLYPKETGTSVDLPREALDWDKRLQEAKEELKRWELVKDESEALLKGWIGEATYGVLPDGAGRYSWKQVRQEIAAKEAHVREFRQLRRLSK